MSEFTKHTLSTAPEAAVPLLQATANKLGFIPNLMATFAESPVTLEASLALGELFDNSSFNSTQRQIILLTISRYHDCTYCLAAHGSIAKSLKVPEPLIEQVYYNQPFNDAKLQVLRDFTRALLDARGMIDQAELELFYDAGYTQQQVMEVILAISYKTITNYINLINDTDIDDLFIQGLPSANKATYLSN